MKYKAVFDSVIAKKLDEDETSYGSIIVPDMGKEKNIVADVIDIGPGRRSIFTGETIPVQIKKGDRVILPQIGITNLEIIDGDEYIAFDEGKVLAIIKED